MRGITGVLFVVGVVAACGNPSRNDNGGNGRPDGGADCTNDGAHRCEGSSYETCIGGQWMTAIDCPTFCSEALGCIECVPGQTFCKDGNVWSCGDDGTPGSEIQQCTGINVCQGGTCVDACADAAANKSYIGCEYWAADLDNAVEVWGFQLAGTCTNGTPQTLNVCYKTQGPFITGLAGLCDPPATQGGAATCPSGSPTCGPQPVCASNAQLSPFGIVISNPQAKDAHVTVTGPGGQMLTQTIAAGQVQAILPQANNAIPDQSIDGSAKVKQAYRIVSDLPIVAYQFNPLDNANVFSNDASLLIPRATFDTDYYVMSYATLDRRTQSPPGKNNYYGYLTIVAWQDGTQIAVTPSANTEASATVAALTAGTTVTFTLNAFEVLQLEAKIGGDLTGTHITSPNMMSFGVFGGHEATAFGETTPPDAQHTNGPGFADHLEEMLFPSSTWGKTFAITRSKARTTDKDLLRIMAQKAGTTVTFTPAPSAGTCGTLGPGQFCDVKISGDTEVTASEPVLVGHYLESATWCNNAQTSCVGNGDPSLALAAPTEQFRKEYTILVPAAYAENYISIAAAATGGVSVERIAPNPMSIPVTLAAYPGGGTHRAARVQLPCPAPLDPLGQCPANASSQYRITCADGCGIEVYGYSDGVSYMFAGGLDLKPIVIF